MEDLVSVIMPVYNTDKYVELAITSVIRQSYPNWELLAVDDGSIDKSREIIETYAKQDSRIKTFRQANSGVSKARNLALSHASGAYICFLDADDWFPADSLQARVDKLKASDAINFVDGHVDVYNEAATSVERDWKPTFRGNPHQQLLRLSPSCFLGLTWMIRRRPGQVYQFNETLNHGEDLLFYTELSRQGGTYDYVDETVYCYRNRTGSAMKNIDGLAEGYLALRKIFTESNHFTLTDRLIFEYKIRRIMFLTYLRSRNIAKALRYLVR